MASLQLLALAISCLGLTHAREFNVTEYTQWTKLEISKLHNDGSIVTLNEEKSVIALALTLHQTIYYNLDIWLRPIWQFQKEANETAKMLFEGTNAEGCLNGIADFLEKSIAEAFDDYNDKTADVPSKLIRLNNTLAKKDVDMNASFQRTMKGIDMCAKTDPNKDSKDRLMSCVEAMRKGYSDKAEDLQRSLNPSPTMAVMIDTVITSVSLAATDVTQAGYKFLQMLVECSKLSGGAVDPVQYAAELNQWKGYNDTLPQQMADAEEEHYWIKYDLQSTMMQYYNLSRSLESEYVFVSSTPDHFQSVFYSAESSYYNTIMQTEMDNPGDSSCTAAAKTYLDAVVNNAANACLSCDLLVVSDTLRLMINISESLSGLNRLLPSTGNAAVLDCLIQGYVYEPLTIIGCYKLNATRFNITRDQGYARISDNMNTLRAYLEYYSGQNVPCGELNFKLSRLGAETMMHALRRCLYITSGSTYEVTTPASSVTPTTTPSGYTPPQ